MCPACSGHGFVRVEVEVEEPDFGKALLCPVCGPQRMEAQRNSLRASLPESLRSWTFDMLQPRVDLTTEQKAQWEHARECAYRFALGESPEPWLVLMGTKGWGKTHLALAIVNERHAHQEYGPPGWYVVAPELLVQLRAGFRDESYERRLDAFRETPLLVLDDLGTEYHRKTSDEATTWAQEQVFLVLNHRHMHGKQTVITSNILPDQMDSRIADRLLDDTTGRVRLVSLSLPSYRSGRTW